MANYMREEEGLQDSSDILLDLLPAGLAVGGAAFGASKLLGKSAAKKASAEAAERLARQKAGAAEIDKLLTDTAAEYPGLAKEFAKAVNKKSPFEQATIDARAKGYDKMTSSDLRKARADLIGDKNVFDLDEAATVHRYAIEDALENAEKLERSQRASKGNLTKADKKALKQEKKMEEEMYQDEWDYIDEGSGKVYSDGMSREEFLEMDNPVFAEEWAKAGYPTLPDNVVDLFAKGKIDKIPSKFVNSTPSGVKKAEEAGVSLGELLSRNPELGIRRR